MFVNKGGTEESLEIKREREREKIPINKSLKYLPTKRLFDGSNVFLISNFATHRFFQL